MSKSSLHLEMRVNQREFTEALETLGSQGYVAISPEGGRTYIYRLAAKKKMLKEEPIVKGKK
jgi:L-lactate utilization protein LutB